MSSILIPISPGKVEAGSTLNTIPARSGTLDVFKAGGSWTSRPMHGRRRDAERLGIPGLGERGPGGWWGADAAAPTAITAGAAACAWTTSAWRCRASEEGSPTNTVRVMSERYPSTRQPKSSSGASPSATTSWPDVPCGIDARWADEHDAVEGEVLGTVVLEERRDEPRHGQLAHAGANHVADVGEGLVRAQARPMASISAALFSSRSSARLDRPGPARHRARLPPAPATWRASSDPLRGRGDGRRPLRATGELGSQWLGGLDEIQSGALNRRLLDIAVIGQDRAWSAVTRSEPEYPVDSSPRRRAKPDR